MLGWMPSSSCVWPQKALQHQTPTSQSKNLLNDRVASGFKVQSQVLSWPTSCRLQPQQLQGHNKGRGTALMGSVAVSPALNPPPRHSSHLPEQSQQLLLFRPHSTRWNILVIQNLFLPGTDTSSWEKWGKANGSIPKTTCRTTLCWKPKWIYTDFLGPSSSFFTWAIYWLVHVCFVPEEKTLPSLWKVHIKWLREHYLPYQLHVSL